MERIEELGVDNLKIIQNSNSYCFTSDATILAEFVHAKKNDRVMEFCSGSGVISILVQNKFKLKNVFAMEVQPYLFEISKKSIELNGQQNNIFVINDKLQNFEKYFEKASFDVVICNPPYKKISSGKVAENPEIAIAKSEILVKLEEIVECARKLLKSKGSFYVCMTPNRLTELLLLLKKYGFEAKEMFFSYPSIKSSPSCVFIKAVKDGKEGVKILPPVITHDESGKFAKSTASLFDGN